MSREELLSLCNLLMVSDPFPNGLAQADILSGLADREARFMGYADWIDFYHVMNNAGVL